SITPIGTAVPAEAFARGSLDGEGHGLLDVVSGRDRGGNGALRQAHRVQVRAVLDRVASEFAGGCGDGDLVVELGGTLQAPLLSRPRVREPPSGKVHIAKVVQDLVRHTLLTDPAVKLERLVAVAQG